MPINIGPRQGPCSKGAQAMAKGQQKSNREAKKPKANKKPPAAAAADPKYTLPGKIGSPKGGK